MKNFFCFAIVIIATSLTAQVNIYNSSGTLTGNRTVFMANKKLTFHPSSGNTVVIDGVTGNVGVNTSNPIEKLEVIGNLRADVGYFIKSPLDGQTFMANKNRTRASVVLSAGTEIDTATGARIFQFYDFPISNMNSTSTTWFSVNNRNNITRLRYWASQGENSQFTLYDKSQLENFSVLDNGGTEVSVILPKANSRLGIGTNSFTDGTDTFNLSVNGNIRAHRVKVYTSWADYVFEQSYKLTPLEDVECYIEENGHLKDIPSSKEVATNGIDLGEMNKLLLQKIEELTLYTIELNKQVQELKQQLNQN